MQLSEPIVCIPKIVSRELVSSELYTVRCGIKTCTSVVVEYICTVPGWYPKCDMQLSEPNDRILKIVSKLALVLL